MKRRMLPSLAAMALLFSLTACRTASPFRNLETFSVGTGGACEALAVLHGEGLSNMDTLGVLDEKHNLHILRQELDTPPKIGRLLVSPDKEYVVIESWGEGNQLLAVYSIPTLVNAAQDDALTLEPFRRLDPYPASVTDIRWAGPSLIRFTADMESDYSRFDKESRRAPYNEDDKPGKPDRTWQWSLDSDTFKEVK